MGTRSAKATPASIEVSGNVTADLLAAHTSMTAGDAATALARLLAAWRAMPAAVLADAIEQVGARAAQGVHPPAGVDAADREAAWLAAAATGDPVIRHRLVETVTDVVDHAARVERLGVLVPHRDPRVAAKIVQLVAASSPSPVHHIPTYWRPLFATLEQCGDPRVRGAIAGLSWTERLRYESAAKRDAFAARLDKLRDRLAVIYPAEPPHLADDERALVDSIVALTTVATPAAARDADVEAGLLAAVYATPADDGPRAIYADWLQERGDPRGELIALQLATAHLDPDLRPPERVRIEDLLAAHHTTWLGSLAAYTESRKFERGFLGTCEILHEPGGTTRRATAPDPAWATVHTITGGMPATDAHPMPVLTSATQLDARAIVRLGTLATLPPLVTLGWRSIDEDWSPSDGYAASTRDAIDAFARVLPRLPSLRRLHLEGAPGWVTHRMRPEQLAWPWRDTSIRELRVTVHLDQLRAWLGATIDSQLDRLDLVGTRGTHGWRVTLSRDAAGVLARLELQHGSNRATFDEDFGAIAAALEALPPAHLTHLVLGVPAKDGWTLERRQRMAQLLDRQPRIATPEIYGFTRPGSRR